ncbi:MAG: hypothetical protein ACYDBY_01600 [Thermoanaerobaculia bacterium]
MSCSRRKERAFSRKRSRPPGAPKPGESAPPGVLDTTEGINGHRIERTVRLRLDIKDATGSAPTHPVLVQMAVGGPKAGKLILDPDGARIECATVSFLWHDQDAEGNVTHPNEIIEYRLGEYAPLVGFRPDEQAPGTVEPVWGVAEQLQIVLSAPDESGSETWERTLDVSYPVRPEPGKPDHFACFDYNGDPCPDVFPFWTGYRLYQSGTRADGTPRLITEPFTIFNAYHLADARGDTTWGYRTVSASDPSPTLTVGFSHQATTGPDFAQYALSVSWTNDPAFPQGPIPATLSVQYPTDPEWPAGTVEKVITLDMQGGETRVLTRYRDYDGVKPDLITQPPPDPLPGTTAVKDGTFPISVSPGAMDAGLPKTSADDGARLVLLTQTGSSITGLSSSPEPTPFGVRLWRSSGTPDLWNAENVIAASEQRLETAAPGAFRLTLIDDDQRLVTDGEFVVHLCPRFEHWAGAPECPTPASVTSVSGVVASVTVNDGSLGRGYLGIELKRAPLAPGTYYVNVESLDGAYRIRRQSDFVTEMDPAAGENKGAFAICSVSGVEILDSSFRRIEPLVVDEITAAYIRMSDPSEVATSFVLDFVTEDDEGIAFDVARDVSLTRLGTSSTFLSEPIELYPEWESGVAGSSIRAQEVQAKKVVVKKKSSGRAKAKRRSTSKVVASRVTKSGADYVFSFGTRAPFSVGTSFTFHDGAGHLFVCSPAAGDCGSAQVLPPAQVAWMLGPFGTDQEGDGQIVRMELETSETPPQAYVRGIRISTNRTTDGFVTLSATSGVETVGPVRLQVRRPWHLGSRTDGYPVTYEGADVELEPIVIDMADRYGIPPQFLMSQVTKEANRTGNPARYNVYSYRYEAYGFDFRFITGDLGDCCDASGHNFVATYHPFLSSGIAGTTGQAEMRPVAPFDEVPVRYEILPQPIGSQPTTAYQIPAGPNGPPVAWDVVVTDTTGVSQYQRTDPGFAFFVGPLGPSQYSVDCRTGRITFGAPPADPAHLKVNYQPARNAYALRNGLGVALGTALSTAQIASSCPGCDVLPPSDPAMTISAWASTRASAGQTLTQTISRYGRTFPSPQNWYLLQEDPSFDVQGQWYGGASFGLLQVWPANANTTINRMSPTDKARIRAIYNPLSEPGTKLFDPQVGTEFGAAGDRYAPLSESQEGNRIAHEPECVPEATSGPFNNCTWSRYWARRFTAFNAGGDDGQAGADAFARYGWPVVENSSSFAPTLQPIQ